MGILLLIEQTGNATFYTKYFFLGMTIDKAYQHSVKLQKKEKSATKRLPGLCILRGLSNMSLDYRQVYTENSL